MRLKERILLGLSIISLSTGISFLIVKETFLEKEIGFISCLLLTVILVFANRYYIIRCCSNAIKILNRLQSTRYEIFDNELKNDSLKNKNRELRRENKILYANNIDLHNEINKLKRIRKNFYYISTKELDLYSKLNLKYIDSLNGLEFEEFIKKLFIILKYKNVKKTKASNDYGVDIIAEKDNKKYAIQCKHYNNLIGNSCVQEVYTGINYYNCNIAVVISNNYFTKNAINLAIKNKVLLWDRDILKDLLLKAKKTYIDNIKDN